MGSVFQPTLIEFYDMGNSVSSTAAGVGTERFAFKPFCSVLTTVQPEVLGTLFNDLDETSGFLNRWLFITGPRKKKQLFNRNIIELGPAVIALRKIHSWAAKKPKVTWSVEAEELFEEAWAEYIQQDVEQSKAALARIDLVIKKLGLLLAINEMSTTVTRDMLERVLVMYPYLKKNTELKTSNMSNNENVNLDKVLIEVIKANEPISGAAAYRKLPKKYRESSTAHDVGRHLRALSEMGFIQAMQKAPAPGKGGRPTVVYKSVEEV
jgi:hypothetical protein